MERLILGLGDLEEGLELVRDGGRVSSMERRRGCSGEAGVVCVDSLETCSVAVVGMTMGLGAGAAVETLVGLS